MPRQFSYAVLAIAALGILLGAVLSVALPDRNVASAVVSGSLGLIALLFATSLMETLQDGYLPGIERDWGGLAGDAAGWRMTPPLVYLIGTCLFATLAVAGLILSALPGEKKPPEKPSVPISAPIHE
jgi:hypothetical protein